jgi:hypothetical protein
MIKLLSKEDKLIKNTGNEKCKGVEEIRIGN